MISVTLWRSFNIFLKIIISILFNQFCYVVGRHSENANKTFNVEINNKRVTI